MKKCTFAGVAQLSLSFWLLAACDSGSQSPLTANLTSPGASSSTHEETFPSDLSRETSLSTVSPATVPSPTTTPTPGPTGSSSTPSNPEALPTQPTQPVATTTQFNSETIAPPPSTPEPFVAGTPPRASRHFRRGLNLGNRLEAPNEGDWGGRILPTDFPFIASRGFDHVRLPVRFSGHAEPSAPYTIDAAFFERIDQVIAQALEAGLAVVLDLHAYEELATDPAAEKERFFRLWAQIATRYRTLPETVAFEPFNEPHGELDSVWNDLLTTAIATIRETNPQRLIVADSVFWADPSRLMDLVLPDDANIMASVHLYEPKLFSFQGQSWMGDAYQTTGVIFPGPPADPVTPVAAALDVDWAASWFEEYNSLPSDTNPSGLATIEAQVSLIASYAQSSGRHVYNGEWGPQDGGDTESRARLIAVVREKCEAADVSWAIWEDTENMSLFDSEAGTWNTPLIDALLPL